MEYKKLGRTDIMVSEIALGCEGLAKKSFEEVKSFVTKASDNGINFIDFYAPNPDMRSNFGKAIANQRDKWVIEGHLCTYWKNNQYLRTRKMDEVISGFEDLLTRLNTDYIDIGMIHYVDSQDDFDQVFEGPVIQYAIDLKRNGKIKHIGISTHNPLIAIQAIKKGLIDVILFSINPCYDMLPPSENVNDLWDDKKYEQPLFNIDPVRQELYELAQKEDVALTVMKAFGGGDLLDEKLSPFKVKMTELQCLHYCLTRPGVVSVMAGCHNDEELEACLEYETATDAKKDYAEVLANVPKHSFKGNCVYCGHCAPCVKGINIAEVNKFVDLCKAHDEVPETVREHYQALLHHASDCIACGQCMKNCPFGVDIISKMAEAKKIFGF
ncbi:aldo/keto reductase [uncultured Thomasclavelia sp.]|uniref:aldo/keto reductase n=1 Tax=uncultured Thomasclavelia sp. TaxID=3025759 RepID=UPI0025D1772E|nr:aldo/keto reductase [uncultured Thomasclavelia sp.]